MHRHLLAPLAVLLFMDVSAQAQTSQYFHVPEGDGPHDVAAAPDGSVWYAGERAGVAGRLDPASGRIDRIPLGKNSAPRGVIIGPDGAPWFTDAGQNAIVRVDPATHEVRAWPLPRERVPHADLNAAASDREGRIWFTGQSGVYGRLDPNTGDMQVWDAPRGHGPFGITATPSGDIWYTSLAGSYLASLDLRNGAVTVYEPPTPNQGASRVSSDSNGRLWVSESNTGNVSVYDPARKSWRQWQLSGQEPRASSVWVDPGDKVWLTDWSSSAVVRFDPETETFESFPSDRPNANARHLHGRKGEAWIPESGTDRLRLIRYDSESD